MVNINKMPSAGFRFPVKGILGGAIFTILLAVWLISTGNSKYLWVSGVFFIAFMIMILVGRKLRDSGLGNFKSRRRY